MLWILICALLGIQEIRPKRPLGPRGIHPVVLSFQDSDMSSFSSVRPQGAVPGLGNGGYQCPAHNLPAPILPPPAPLALGVLSLDAGTASPLGELDEAGVDPHPPAPRLMAGRVGRWRCNSPFKAPFLDRQQHPAWFLPLAQPDSPAPRPVFCGSTPVASPRHLTPCRKSAPRKSFFLEPVPTPH